MVHSNLDKNIFFCFCSGLFKPIKPRDLASKIKNLDILRESGTLLRELLQDVDFGLDDKFCDDEEIKNSWENTHMPEGLLTFFSSLVNIFNAQMANIQSVVGVDEY